MSLTKRYLERQMEEEWSSVGDKYVCSQCFIDVDDYALSTFIADNASAHECSYCENVSESPIAAKMDDVISFISSGIHHEYEDPVHGVGYCSAEGGYFPTRERLFAPHMQQHIRKSIPESEQWDGGLGEVGHTVLRSKMSPWRSGATE